MGLFDYCKNCKNISLKNIFIIVGVGVFLVLLAIGIYIGYNGYNGINSFQIFPSPNPSNITDLGGKQDFLNGSTTLDLPTTINTILEFTDSFPDSTTSSTTSTSTSGSNTFSSVSSSSFSSTTNATSISSSLSSYASSTSSNVNTTFKTTSTDRTTIEKTELPIIVIDKELDENVKLKRCPELPEWECNFRLNPAVIPNSYNIYLHPNLTFGNYSGNVTINLTITKPVHHIRLHSKQLNITSTKLYFKDQHFKNTSNESTPVELEDTFEWPANEFFVIKTTNWLSPGDYTLSLFYKGSLKGGIIGFYQGSYFDPIKKKNMTFATTKFQPTYARRAFPCFDEPSFKSIFHVSLRIDKMKDRIAISNMPIMMTMDSVDDKNHKIIFFEKSPPMVTYLVAVAIGDFKALNNFHLANGPNVSVYATSFQVQNVEYALNITTKVLKYFENYFDVKYPLPKLDIIGIPNFVSGAMEHFGMISFREANLLFNPKFASTKNKQRIAVVIAHELAHQWFGNLMTLAEWKDLFLNEGFASYMEYKGVEAAEPSWEIQTQFSCDDMVGVLHKDGLESSHPIVQEVNNSDQITELFDSITYQKGAAIIRMLESFMGKKNFQKGISAFLKKYHFKNAVSEDLWKELQKFSSPTINISNVMESWITQKGYPIIDVVIEETDKFLMVHLTQKPFTQRKNDSINPEWVIPIHVESYWNSTNKLSLTYNVTFWPTKNSSTFNVISYNNTSHPHHKHYIEKTIRLKINPKQIGFFRVRYTESEYLLHKKEELMINKYLTPEEKCSLLDDAAALAYENHLNYTIALELISTMENITEYVPWACMKYHFKNIGQLLQNSDPSTYHKYKAFMRKIVSKEFSKKSNNTISHLDKLQYPILFDISCEYEDFICINKSSMYFHKWLSSLNTTKPWMIPLEIRGTVYKLGIKHGNEETWNKVWKMYLKETNPQEKTNLLYSLGYSQDPKIIKKFLEYGKNEDFVLRQDYFTMFYALTTTPNGNKILWDFYRDEYEYLVKRFTLNHRTFGRVISTIAQQFTNETQLNEIYEFYSKYPDGGAGARERKYAIEGVKGNMRWVKYNIKIIKEWLTKKGF